MMTREGALKLRAKIRRKQAAAAKKKAAEEKREAKAAAKKAATAKKRAKKATVAAKKASKKRPRRKKAAKRRSKKFSTKLQVGRKKVRAKCPLGTTLVVAGTAKKSRTKGKKTVQFFGRCVKM